MLKWGQYTSVQSGLSISIRCKHPFDATYHDYGISEKVAAFIQNAVIAGKHIIISGDTNTGKTTLLNLMLKSLDAATRLVVLEDTPEVQFDRFWDSVGLIASRTGASPSMLSWSSLYDHSNRITPDRLIFSEISTKNSEAALALMNSGGSGFMCTIHASTPEMALKRKFGQNLDMAGTPMQAVDGFLYDMLDLVIQIDRSEGKRQVVSVWDVKNKTELLR